MKKRILFLSLAIMLLFVSRPYAQTIRISSSAGDTICSGNSTTFTATVTPAGTYGYSWKLNGVSVGASLPTYTPPSLLSGKDTIHCFLTNVAGDTIKARSDTVIMVVDTLPAISAISGEDSICVGSSHQLSDSVGGGIWSSGNVVAATVSTTGLVTGVSVPVGMTFFGFTLPAPPVYITYTLSNGCGTDSVRQQIYLAAPAGPIIVPANSVCIGDSITLGDTTTGGLWVSSDSTVASFPSGFLAAIFPSDLLGNTPGTVTITYAGINGCGSFLETTTINVVNCDSISAVPQVTSLAQGCSIYPNPAAGLFNIAVRSGKYSEVNCTVSDMVGKKVKDMMISTNQEIPVQMNVPSGVYFITISAGNERYTSKLVIIQ